MSAVRVGNTWRRIAQLLVKSASGWSSPQKVYVKMENVWQEVDVFAEQQAPKLYTWVAYANNPNLPYDIQSLKGVIKGKSYSDTIPAMVDPDGAGFSFTPEGKAHMGVATGMRSEPASLEDPNVYQWVNLVTYTWTKYADSIDGSGMSDSPAGKLFIGHAYNRTSPTESNDPSDYVWSILGSDELGDIQGKLSEIDELAKAILDGVVEGEGNFEHDFIKLIDLESVSGDNKAAIEEYAVTFADEQQAVAAKFSSLTASVNWNAANLSMNYYTKASTDEAIAASVTTLEAKVDDNQARLEQNYYTKASTDLAVAAGISEYNAQVGNTYATITNLNLAKSDIDGNALSISNLQTRVGNAEGEIADANLELSATNDAVSGLSARAYLGVDVAGNVSGIHIEGSATESSIKMQAGSFEWLDSGGTPVVYWGSGSYTFEGRGSFSSGLDVDFNQSSLRVGITKAGGLFDGVDLNAGSNYVWVSSSSIQISANNNAYFQMGTDGVISQNGKLSQGSAPSANLLKPTLFDSASYDAGLSATVRVVGKVYASQGYLPFTGAHRVAVRFGEPCELGDLLVETTLIDRTDINNALFEGVRCTSASQKNVIGVASHFRDISINSDAEEMGVTKAWAEQNLLDYRIVHVNAVGEGLMNVCGLGGNIQAGDLLVASDIAGKAMRQDDDLVRGITVGRAREPVVFSSPDEVKQIAVIYLCG